MDGKEFHALRTTGWTVTVVLNNVAIQRFFQQVVLENMRRRGDRVEAIARANASGVVLNTKTNRLVDRMQTVAVLGAEPYVKVGTTATTDGFSYPAYWDQNPQRLRRGTEKRWLTDALRDGFREPGDK